MATTAHIRIETRTPRTAGLPTVCQSDRVVVVTDDGQHVDISDIVSCWSTGNNVGEVRKLTLDVFRFHVAEVPYEPSGQSRRMEVTSVGDHTRVFQDTAA